MTAQHLLARFEGGGGDGFAAGEQDFGGRGEALSPDPGFTRLHGIFGYVAAGFLGRVAPGLFGGVWAGCFGGVDGGDLDFAFAAGGGDQGDGEGGL